jgi:hypothetical protein
MAETNPELVAELKAQLEDHEKMRVLCVDTNADVEVTNVSYDSFTDCVVVEVEL